MAQIIEQPILSLCIPIYNRLSYLERQLARMLEDKDLFKNQIQLIISDNFSTDDLRSCCEKYQQKGLNLIFHRNETNIGPDGNFEWCFRHADGKYVWLLGSDDIPVSGMLRDLLAELEGRDYGIVHLSTCSNKEPSSIYSHDETIVADIGVWITFMSANIIRTQSLKTIDLSDYVGSFMIQVPAYLNAALTASQNSILFLGQLFEKDTDGANNGGYNLFQVFVENLFGIYEQFVSKGLMSNQTFELTKRMEYKNWLVNFVIDLLILKKSRRKNFDMTNSWLILHKHYGNYSYFYYYTIMTFIRKIIKCGVKQILCIITLGKFPKGKV